VLTWAAILASKHNGDTGELEGIQILSRSHLPLTGIPETMDTNGEATAFKLAPPVSHMRVSL
jgi:hypothetical protein